MYILYWKHWDNTDMISIIHEEDLPEAKELVESIHKGEYKEKFHQLYEELPYLELKGKEGEYTFKSTLGYNIKEMPKFPELIRCFRNPDIVTDHKL